MFIFGLMLKTSIGQLWFPYSTYSTSPLVPGIASKCRGADPISRHTGAPVWPVIVTCAGMWPAWGAHPYTGTGAHLLRLWSWGPCQACCCACHSDPKFCPESHSLPLEPRSSLVPCVFSGLMPAPGGQVLLTDSGRPCRRLPDRLMNVDPHQGFWI